jgi:hypothetical protein
LGGRAATAAPPGPVFKNKITIMPKAAPTYDQRVTRGYELRRQIEDLQAALLVIEQQLIARGPGQYGDDAGLTATAVGAVPPGTGPESYALREGEEEKARTLAGPSFAELFDRKVSYTPQSGFADRADALLTPAKKRDLLALCYVPGRAKPGRAGYVLWK